MMQQELTPFELERKRRIEENTRRLAELGVVAAARDLAATLKPPLQRAKPVARNTNRRKAARRQQPTRTCRRLHGEAPEFEAGIGSDDEAVGEIYYDKPLKDLLADDSTTVVVNTAAREEFQATRCNSLGRGSIYDSAAGITCHFCRQKKLCGEEGCPRCSTRNTEAECIGKTECVRCHGATGRFCRACLLLRYGQTLEEARAAMAEGSWLCPHCHEEEHPEDGWICNSSICMKRRGYKPTGIAIYDAQQRGYASVAHWLQAQLRAGPAGAAAAPPTAAPRAGPAGAAAAPPTAAPRAMETVAAEEAVPAAAASAVEPATPAKAVNTTTSSSNSGAKEVAVAAAKGGSKKVAADAATGAGSSRTVVPEVACPTTPALTDASNKPRLRKRLLPGVEEEKVRGGGKKGVQQELFVAGPGKRRVTRAAAAASTAVVVGQGRGRGRGKEN